MWRTFLPFTLRTLLMVSSSSWASFQSVRTRKARIPSGLRLRVSCLYGGELRRGKCIPVPRTTTSYSGATSSMVGYVVWFWTVEGTRGLGVQDIGVGLKRVRWWSWAVNGN